MKNRDLRARPPACLLDNRDRTVETTAGLAASKQPRTTPQTVYESVLTWSTGAALVRRANATIDRSLHQFKLQHARDRGSHHSAFLLLRRRRRDHAVALDSAGLLS